MLKKIIDFIQHLDRKKRILYIFLLVLFIFLMTVSVSPIHKMKEFENIVKSDSIFSNDFNSMLNQPELSVLVKEKANLEALLKLAEKDSIQLVINLRDSSACLFINGVKIHQSEISKFKSDKLLQKMPLIQYVKLFSDPVEIISQYATIVKEPVVVRQAPKDTAEAALTAWKPDTLIQKPAFLLLKMDYGIRIIFEQELNERFADKWVRKSFYTRQWFGKGASSLGRFFTLRKQEYNPTIKILLPADDLRAIYRALPQSAELVLIF